MECKIWACAKFYVLQWSERFQSYSMKIHCNVCHKKITSCSFWSVLRSQMCMMPLWSPTMIWDWSGCSITAFTGAGTWNIFWQRMFEMVLKIYMFFIRFKTICNWNKIYIIQSYNYIIMIIFITSQYYNLCDIFLYWLISADFQSQNGPEVTLALS